ncbi:MAG TPA: tetratricopeptide repeat protein [Lutibacter sp.]|nr:tetratricopeptide repeat protein [Lutibacter sp.]
MNSAEFTYLLQHPENIDALKTQALDEVISEFPYFQSARAIQLKGLNKTNSFKYNQTLKKTAAYTIDRKVLFDFITSPIFIIKSETASNTLEEIEVIDPEDVKALHKKITDSFSNKNIETEATAVQNEEVEKETDVLEIGKPIQFVSSEPHSFNEWMQLIAQKPIEREEIPSRKIEKIEDKFNLIDRFIELNPKIKPVDKNAINLDVTIDSSAENESLMTETLAKVYLEQKKYENAIKAYRILILKYPEKSGFFADRIKAIKNLQKNKS